MPSKLILIAYLLTFTFLFKTIHFPFFLLALFLFFGRTRPLSRSPKYDRLSLFMTFADSLFLAHLRLFRHICILIG